MTVENKPEQGVVRRLTGLLPPIRERRQFNEAAKAFLASLEPFKTRIDRLDNHDSLELPMNWPPNASEQRKVTVQKVPLGYIVEIFRISSQQKGDHTVNIGSINKIGVYTASYPAQISRISEGEDDQHQRLVNNLSRKTKLMYEVTKLLTGTKATDNLPHG